MKGMGSDFWLPCNVSHDEFAAIIDACGFCHVLFEGSLFTLDNGSTR